MSAVPYTGPEAVHRRQLAEGVNAALRGETNNAGQVTIPAGASEFVLQDARLGVGKVLVLVPANAAAAGSGWYVDSVMNGQAAIYFKTAQAGQSVFSYVVVGAGGTGGRP